MAQVEEKRMKKQLEEEQRKREEQEEECRLAKEQEMMKKQFEDDLLRQKQKEVGIYPCAGVVKCMHIQSPMRFFFLKNHFMQVKEVFRNLWYLKSFSSFALLISLCIFLSLIGDHEP